MKSLVKLIIAALVVCLVSSLSATSSDARGGGHGGHGPRVGVGFWLGPEWWPGWGWPYYYPSYYPSYPAEQTIVIQQQPEMYEQTAPQLEHPAYWYFCREPQGYYPYVKSCPGGWMKVVPTPPDSSTVPPE